MKLVAPGADVKQAALTGHYPPHENDQLAEQPMPSTARQRKTRRKRCGRSSTVIGSHVIVYNHRSDAGAAIKDLDGPAST